MLSLVLWTVNMAPRSCVVRQCSQRRAIVPYGTPNRTSLQSMDALKKVKNVKDVKDLKCFDCIKDITNDFNRHNMVLSKHAEENVLSKFFKSNNKIKSRSKLQIVVIRIDANENLTNSKPCNHCIEIMRSYGVRKVTYSTKEGTCITESINIISGHISSGYRSIGIVKDILSIISKDDLT